VDHEIHERHRRRRSRRTDRPRFHLFQPCTPVRGEKNLGEIGFRLGNRYRLALAVDYFRSFKGVTGVMDCSRPGQLAPVNLSRSRGPSGCGSARLRGGLSSPATYRFRHRLRPASLSRRDRRADGVTPSRGGLEFARTIAEMRDLRKLYDPAAKLPARVAARRTAFLWSHDVLWDLETHKQTALWDTWDHRFKMMAAVKAAGAPLDYVGEGDGLLGLSLPRRAAYQLVDEALMAKWTRYVEGRRTPHPDCRTGQKTKSGQLPEAPWAGLVAPLAAPMSSSSTTSSKAAAASSA